MLRVKKFYFFGLVILSVLTSFTLGFLVRPNPTKAQLDPNIDLEQCAQDLTDYMNTVLEAVGTPQHAILTSIAFNLTSPFEWEIYQYMVEDGANFDSLEYMAGNSYNRYNQGAAHDLNITAYEWYASHYGWKASFGGKPMIFTEYGDFAPIDKGRATNGASYDINTDYYTSEEIQAMVTEFNKLGSNERALFFAPLSYTPEFSQPEFAFHSIKRETGDLSSVITDKSKGGINSGRNLDSGGGFATEANNYGKYVLEIITGPDVAGVVQYINGLPEGMIPVIRSCWGSSCGMKNPLVLSDFIKSVDSQVSRPWHVLVGPNEPLTDPWVSDACGVTSERIWEWQKAQCGDTLDPEFHSLRPYPGNWCPPTTEVQKVLMCGNQITASETFKVYAQSSTHPDGISLGSCNQGPITPTQITYDGPAGISYTDTLQLRTWICPDVPINSTAELTINLTDSELPVLGNTEDVPNASSGTNSLTFANRMNNYVSWYLQGVFQTAEEEFASPTDPQGVRDMLDYAGPIQKLLPHDILRNQWVGQETIPLGGSHNQIVVCMNGGPEACYIDDSQSRVRKAEARANEFSIAASYIPLSTTEDELGQVRLLQEGAIQPGLEDGNDVEFIAPTETSLGTTQNPYLSPNDFTTGSKTYDALFYPHARESLQLSDLIQKTFVPNAALPRAIGLPGTVNGERRGWISTADGMPPVDDPEFEYNGKFCKVVDAFSNPGDNLYGWLDDNNYAADGTDPNADPPAIAPGYEGIAYDAQNIKAQIKYEGTAECEFKESINNQCYTDCRTDFHQQCLPDYECEYNGGTWDPSASSCPTGFVDCRWTSFTGGSQSYCQDYCNDETVCEVTGMASAYVETESPWLENIWNRLVNGSMSVYRRIFPRLAANNRNLPQADQIVVPGPEKFENIPGVTTAEYGMTHLDGNQEYVDGSGKGLGGNPTEGNSQGDLYFPYLGSIHEYFFDDIQCALKPFGIGCPDTVTLEEEVDNLGNTGTANCNNVPDSSIPAAYVSFKARYVDLANRWLSSDDDTNHAEECYNDVVFRARRAGVNPLFALAIWLNESDASNYEASTQAWQDFGINNASVPAEDFNAQITRFLDIADSPNAYRNVYPSCFSNSAYTDMQVWMSIFHLGPNQCSDGVPDLTYYNAIKGGAWAFITSCPFISSPTSTSCGL